MFQTFLVQPFYNGFIFLVGIMPGGDVGFAIITLTLILRALFYPLFTTQIRTQMAMQAAQGELDQINKQYKDNPEERAKKTMALFRERGIRPFTSILTIIVQIPVFIALYFAFFRENLPEIATGLLYPFVPAPDVVNVSFFGLNLLEPHHLGLALVVGGLQYAVAHLSLARIGAPAASLAPERAAMHRMQQQIMLYVLPVSMMVASYLFPGGVGLYFAASNAISLGQEWLVRKELAKRAHKPI